MLVRLGLRPAEVTPFGDSYEVVEEVYEVVETGKDGKQVTRIIRKKVNDDDGGH